MSPTEQNNPPGITLFRISILINISEIFPKDKIIINDSPRRRK